jgi:hypothetical protein
MIADWRAWRACRKQALAVHVPKPEPKLNVFETFLHLNAAGRVTLVLCAVAAYCLNVQATFGANVLPHLQNVIGPDGHFNMHELTLALYLSGVVLILTLSPLLIWRAPWVTKPGLVIMAILLANASINNSSKTLKHAADAEIGTLKDKKSRMALLTAQKNAADAAWKRIPQHDHVSAERLASARAEFDQIAHSAQGECNPRGPKCERLEGQRKTQGDKVDRLAHDKDLTDQEDDLRRAFTEADAKLQAEGAEVESTEAPVAPFPQLLANIHIISRDVAVGWSKDQPTTDALTMEFQAWFGAPASVGFVFWLFGLFTSSKSEVERRLVEVAKEVAEERAKVVLSAVPHAPVERVTGVAQMEPDHSEEAVLGIEGEELPAFAQAPRTIAEANAAAFVKHDPDRNYDRKARTLKEASPDSVRQWFKERIVGRVGRSTKSQDAIADYEAWCEAMNVKPVNPTRFGLVLKNELGVEKEGKSGRVKYLNIGLRPAALRVVA